MISLHKYPTIAAKLAPMVLAAATVLLASCGGGGGGGSDPGPQGTVDAVFINPVAGNSQNLMVTVTGSALAAGLQVSSAKCTTLTRTTTAPASDSSTAYYLCTNTEATGSTVSVTAADKSAAFTVGAPSTVAQALAGEGALPATLTNPARRGDAKYSQLMTVTVSGTNVNQGLEVFSSSCSNMALSTSPPFISTASTAYYRCTANSANGLAQVTVNPASNPAQDPPLANPLFFVDTPQVTLTLLRDTVPMGSLVLTLTPNETPLTVGNFLGYVNSGFYNGTIFHRIVTQERGGQTVPFIVQGGGYGPTSGLPAPAPKPTKAPIPLEVANGLRNVQWSVAMARLPGVANSATAEFFINMVDNPGLDPSAGSAGFAVFGTITAGTDMASAIAAAFCTDVGFFSECLPTPNIIINSAVQTR